MYLWWSGRWLVSRSTSINFSKFQPSVRRSSNLCRSHTFTCLVYIAWPHQLRVYWELTPKRGRSLVNLSTFLGFADSGILNLKPDADVINKQTEQRKLVRAKTRFWMWSRVKSWVHSGTRVLCGYWVVAVVDWSELNNSRHAVLNCLWVWQVQWLTGFLGGGRASRMLLLSRCWNWSHAAEPILSCENIKEKSMGEFIHVHVHQSNLRSGCCAKHCDPRAFAVTCWV